MPEVFIKTDRLVELEVSIKTDRLVELEEGLDKLDIPGRALGVYIRHG